MESVVSAGDWRIEREGTMGLLFLVYWCDLNLLLDGSKALWVMTLKAPIQRWHTEVLSFPETHGGDCKTGAWGGILLFIFIFFITVVSKSTNYIVFSFSCFFSQWHLLSFQIPAAPHLSCSLFQYKPIPLVPLPTSKPVSFTIITSPGFVPALFHWIYQV